MKQCHYCRMPLTCDDCPDEHPACVAEWNRRYDVRKCTVCGERAAVPDDYLCGSCNEGDPYVNYPGGATDSGAPGPRDKNL